MKRKTINLFILCTCLTTLLLACVQAPTPTPTTEPTVPVSTDNQANSNDNNDSTAAQNQNDTSLTNTPTPDPTATPIETERNPNLIAGESVIVENMSVNVMESSPIQVSVTVQGNLPNGCTTITHSEAMLNVDTFEVHIYTEVNPLAACAEVLTPFEETIPLNVPNWVAGSYKVQAYDKTEKFEITPENATVKEVPASETACPETTPDTTLLRQEDKDLKIGYCFLYPVHFERMGSGAANIINIMAPVPEDGSSPVGVSLNVQAVDSGGKSLQTYVDQQINERAPGGGVAQKKVTLGQATPAIAVEGYPGLFSTRVIYAQHNEVVYIFTFSPTDRNTGVAREDMVKLNNMVLSTWQFLD